MRVGKRVKMASRLRSILDAIAFSFAILLETIRGNWPFGVPKSKGTNAPKSTSTPPPGDPDHDPYGNRTHKFLRLDRFDG